MMLFFLVDNADPLWDCAPGAELPSPIWLILTRRALALNAAKTEPVERVQWIYESDKSFLVITVPQKLGTLLTVIQICSQIVRDTCSLMVGYQLLHLPKACTKCTTLKLCATSVRSWLQ